MGTSQTGILEVSKNALDGTESSIRLTVRRLRYFKLRPDPAKTRSSRTVEFVYDTAQRKNDQQGFNANAKCM